MLLSVLLSVCAPDLVCGRRPASCAEITEDAERVAAASGGWRSRAVGCCTTDVLVSSLSSTVQQRIHAAFEHVVMPAVTEFFPQAETAPKSLSLSTDKRTVVMVIVMMMVMVPHAPELRAMASHHHPGLPRWTLRAPSCPTRLECAAGALRAGPVSARLR